MADLLCIGHATYDTFLKVQDAEVHCDVNNESCLVCFGFGLKVPVKEVHYGVGGGASNIGVGCAELGINTAIYTIVGSDTKGTEIAASLLDKKVDTTHIHMDELTTDQSSILSYSEERTIFTYSEDREYRLDSLDNHYPYVLLSSVGKRVTKLYDDIIEIKKKNPNMVVFYNPGSKELKYCNEDIKNLLPIVDYLIVNIEEGCLVVNDTLKRENIEMNDLSNMLIDLGVKNVVLTDGEKGVYTTNETDQFHTPAKITKVVEKTGAGDAFASGFISGIISEVDIKDAVKWGIANSSSVIQAYGAQNGLLKKDEIGEALNNLAT